MPFDHDVDILIGPLCSQHQGLDLALVDEPHLQAALVSRRLDARVSNNAIALILHRQDIAAAKKLVRLQPFMEQVELEAIGLDFEGFDCSAAFNHEIARYMPADAARQRVMLALLANTVPRTSETAGKWFARLFREQGYELTDASIALLCAYIWYSQNPVTTAGRLVHHVWDDATTLGKAAAEARTFGRWLLLTLQASGNGLPAWFSGGSYRGLDLAPIASAAEARDIAGLFGSDLYPSIADKLEANAACFLIARQAKDGQIIGCIEFAALAGRDYLYPAAIHGRPDMSQAAKLPAAAYHLLEIAHRPVGGLQPLPPRRIPIGAILATRWDDHFAAYFDAVGPGPLFPLEPDVDTLRDLAKAVEELRGVATPLR